MTHGVVRGAGGEKARESERGGARERRAGSWHELAGVERRTRGARQGADQQSCTPAVPGAAQTVNVTGLELDEDMDEDRLVGIYEHHRV